MSNRTMAQVRAECAELGITPGRSIAECERRIAERRASPGFLGAAINAAAREAIAEAHTDAVVFGTGVVEVSAEGARHVPLGEFAQAAIAEAPEPITPEEEQAMREYSAEMRRMDTMGEARWIAEQFQPRMSRMARALCDFTALRTTLAGWPGVYRGSPHDVRVPPLMLGPPVRVAIMAHQAKTGRTPSRLPIQNLWR